MSENHFHPFVIDISDNIGLEALAKRIDVLILAHIQPHLHQCKVKYEEVKKEMDISQWIRHRLTSSERHYYHLNDVTCNTMMDDSHCW